MTLLFVTDTDSSCFPASTRLDIQIEVRDLAQVLKSCTDFDDLLLYVDCRCLDAYGVKSTIKKLEKSCPRGVWGLYDPDGIVEDPALVFHSGAGDYIGPSLLNHSPDTKRFKRVHEWAKTLRMRPECQPHSTESAVVEKKFPGWKYIPEGELRDFYFLYVAAEDADLLREKLGERRWEDINSRLSSYLGRMLEPCEGLQWMKNEVASLYLIPAEGQHSQCAVDELMRFLLNLPLLSADLLDLDTVFPLVFALHKGRIPFKKPGTTGTMISDDINFIFHLGAKKAEPGRLSIAASAFDAIRDKLGFLFVNAGVFEGKNIKKSRRFL